MNIKSIEEYRRHFLEEWNKLQDLKDPSYIYDPVKHIIQSEGKRLRPIIVQFLGDILILLVKRNLEEFWLSIFPKTQLLPTQLN